MLGIDIIGEVRKGHSRSFVTADQYFSSIQPCFGGGDLCPAKIFKLADETQWTRAFKDAEKILTYCEKDSLLSLVAKAGESSVIPLSKGSILDFDCIITTTRKDRDGDILETGGALLDPMCPLLWQHIPIQPIGRLAGKGQHTKDVLSGRFSILDTDLGRDAAVLVEGGALRISHGFEPLEFKPLESKGGRWHILKFQVVEVSLVSVPSNTDAVIRAFDRHKLHSPLIKSWAKLAHDGRPVVVPGITFEKCACGGACDSCKSTKADAVQECVSNKIKIIADDHPEWSPEQREAVAFSMCGEGKSFEDAEKAYLSASDQEKQAMSAAAVAAVKRPVGQGPLVPATNGDMTMGPQQDTDTDWKPHREIIRRIVQVGHDENTELGKATMFYNPKEFRVWIDIGHPYDLAKAKQITDKFEKIEGVIKAIVASCSPDKYNGVEAELMNGKQAGQTITINHEGYIAIGEIVNSIKAGAALSSANYSKLGMAKEHLEHALSLGEKAFHPSAHALVKGAHGILNDMHKPKPHSEPDADDDPDHDGIPDDQDEDDMMTKGGREFSESNLGKIKTAHDHLDKALGMGEDHFHPSAHILVKASHGILKEMCKGYKGFEMAAPSPSQEPGAAAIVTHGPEMGGWMGAPGSPGSGGLHAPENTSSVDGSSRERTDGHTGMPPRMPQMFNVNRDETTGAEKSRVFNWDIVTATLLFVADDNFDKAMELHTRLGERLKQIQKRADVELACEYLFAD